MNENEWIRSIDRQSVLVVGNGVLSREVPEDKYRTIIRINNFILGGKSGEIVTHWATSGYIDIEKRPLEYAFIPWSREWQNRRNRYDLMFSSRIGIPVVHAASNRHIINWFPSAITKWKTFPSVGFCLISLLHSHRIKPDIIGFDGMQTGHEGNPYHKHGHHLTRTMEWKIINQMIGKDLNLQP